MPKLRRQDRAVTRTKRGFGSIRKRSSGRYEAFYMGPDQSIHRASATFDLKGDAEAWLARERRLIQDDQWSPTNSRRATIKRASSTF